MGPRDTTTVPKLEQAQKVFQGQRERYQKVRDDLSVKIKLVEENRVSISRTSLRLAAQLVPEPEVVSPPSQVKVLHNHLLLLHGAVAAHCLSCHSFLQHNMQQAVEKLQRCGVDDPSWLEGS